MELEQFLFDTSHAPRARRLAYEILLRGDPSLADRVLPKALDDPSLELRRDAVARVLADADRIAAAEPIDPAPAVAAYQKAFDAARDSDQVKHAAEQLAHLGQHVNLPEHFGFITDLARRRTVRQSGEEGIRRRLSAGGRRGFCGQLRRQNR